MRLTSSCKLLCIGDSITDCNRARPVGEGLFDAIGKHGWVREVDGLLQAVYPELAVRVVNQGISGNTVRDLAGRWQTDVLDLKPNWLAVMIGTNDIWRQFDTPFQREWAVDLEEYRSTYGSLLAKTRPGLDGLVLMTPFYIGNDRSDPMRRQIDAYSAVVRDLAQRHDALYVDTQAVMDRLTACFHPTAIAWDRIHPTHVGHVAIAREFLEAIGFDWRHDRDVARFATR